MTTVQSIGKAHRNQEQLDKTERFLRQNPHGIRIVELAKKVGVKRSTVYGLLKTLDLQKKASFERGTAYSPDSTEGARLWHEHGRIFPSCEEFDCAVEHSKQLFVSVFGESSPFKVHHRYDEMLDWLIFSDTIESKWGDRINKNLSCFWEHIRSGYTEIDAKLKEYRERIEKIRDVPCSETVVCEPTNEKGFGPVVDSVQSLPKDCEKLKIWLYWEIYRLNDLVQHGTPLKGTCDSCPERRMVLKDA